MRIQYNILWVEDETEDSLAELRGFLSSSLKFNVTIAENYFDAIVALTNNSNFNLIIVDIRIPNGKTKIEDLSAENIHFQRFGFDLIEYIINKNVISSNKIFVYTNESWADIASKMEKFNIKNESYLQKEDTINNKHFESIILKLMSGN